MAVEILYPDVANLFGDGRNIQYLEDALPGEEFIHTKLNDRPYFADNTPAIIYIGAMTEKMQRNIITRLLPFKARLLELIDNGTVVLATGNGCEIFAKEIDYVTENIKTEALGIVDLTVKTDFFARYNGKVLGKFEDMDIVGFRSQFGLLYGDNSAFPFVKVERGIGINKESTLEGFRIKNLIGTQLIGPILPLNPDFAAYIIRLAGLSGEPAYADKARLAYDTRLKEFRNPTTDFTH